jgi:DNA-binding transcriptional LysR family regulator
LEELPLIYREKGSGTRMAMEDFISSNELNVAMRMELSSNEAVKQAILAGLGYSVMPLIGIRNELARNELQIIQVDNLPITTCWNLISLKNKRFSPVAKAYLRFIEENKSAIIRDSFGWADLY